MDCTFVLPGDPVPQPRPRFAVLNGHAMAYTPKDHAVVPFRQGVALAARAAVSQPMTGSVRLEVEFIFGRPASHWTKTGLSSTAKPRPRPDWDNLGKAVSDAMNGIAYLDDEQVVQSLVVKRYAARGEQPRTIVRLTEVDA